MFCLLYLSCFVILRPAAHNNIKMISQFQNKRQKAKNASYLKTGSITTAVRVDGDDEEKIATVIVQFTSQNGEVTVYFYKLFLLII